MGGEPIADGLVVCLEVDLGDDHIAEAKVVDSGRGVGIQDFLDASGAVGVPKGELGIVAGGHEADHVAIVGQGGAGGGEWVGALGVGEVDIADASGDGVGVGGGEVGEDGFGGPQRSGRGEHERDGRQQNHDGGGVAPPLLADDAGRAGATEQSWQQEGIIGRDQPRQGHHAGFGKEGQQREVRGNLNGLGTPRQARRLR